MSGGCHTIVMGGLSILYFGSGQECAPGGNPAILMNSLMEAVLELKEDDQVR